MIRQMNRMRISGPALAVASLLFLSSCDQPGARFVDTTGNPGGQDNTDRNDNDGGGSAQPVFITTMTHMESSFLDDQSQDVFLNHVAQLRFGMDLADEYAAKLTIESEKPFARANTLWNLNIMQEILDRGHGVGTHCDIGLNDPLMAVADFAALLAENKALVDDLVGAGNNRGCSGAAGVNDWALAGAMAGYEYVNGIVGAHYLSMPLSARPDETWTDEYIRAEGFHEPAPVDLYERIYPFEVADATDFVPDAAGGTLVSAGDIGRLDRLAEAADGFDCRDSCDLTDEDVEVLLDTIDDVIANRDPARLTKVTVYFAVTNFIFANETVLRSFFEAVESRQADGQLTWATQGEVLDAYRESQNGGS